MRILSQENICDRPRVQIPVEPIAFAFVVYECDFGGFIVFGGFGEGQFWRAGGRLSEDITLDMAFLLDNG